MRKYQQFSGKQFEWELRNMSLGFIKDITEQWLSDGHNVWEIIYSVSTKNKSVDIIIFSSIDMRTRFVRDHGNDMVRIVLRWKTKHGYVYKRIHHHQRINTLFKNLKNTIQQTQSEVFNLNFKEFKREA